MNKRILAIILLLVLLLGLGITVALLVNQQTRFTSRATIIGSFSAENSYLFASPLVAGAGGQEKIRITVFALDSQGVGVEGKSVFLGKDKNLTVESIQSVTDKLGKAVFDLSSSVAAEYVVQAQVEDKVLSQTVKVVFR